MPCPRLCRAKPFLLPLGLGAIGLLNALVFTSHIWLFTLQILAVSKYHACYFFNLILFSLWRRWTPNHFLSMVPSCSLNIKLLLCSNSHGLLLHSDDPHDPAPNLHCQCHCELNASDGRRTKLPQRVSLELRMSKVLPLARLPIPLNFKGGSGAGFWKKNEATVGISSMWPRCSWVFWVKCGPRRWTWTFSGTGAVGGKDSKRRTIFWHIQKIHIWIYMNAEYIYIYIYIYMYFWRSVMKRYISCSSPNLPFQLLFLFMKLLY